VLHLLLDGTLAETLAVRVCRDDELPFAEIGWDVCATLEGQRNAFSAAKQGAVCEIVK